MSDAHGYWRCDNDATYLYIRLAVGVCNGSGAVPICDCSDDWMGPKCDLPCVHGTKFPNLTCDCHGCYSGTGCNDTCGGHGECVNNKCVCSSTDGWWGK